MQRTQKDNQELNERIRAAIPEGIVVVPNIRFDFDGMTAFALHTLRMPPDQAVAWVQQQFDQMVEALNSLKPGDIVVSAMPSDKENR